MVFSIICLTISVVCAILSLGMAFWAILEVKSFQKSTHKVELVSAQSLLRDESPEKNPHGNTLPDDEVNSRLSENEVDSYLNNFKL